MAPAAGTQACKHDKETPTDSDPGGARETSVGLDRCPPRRVPRAALAPRTAPPQVHSRSGRFRAASGAVVTTVRPLVARAPPPKPRAGHGTERERGHTSLSVSASHTLIPGRCFSTAKPPMESWR